MTTRTVEIDGVQNARDLGGIPNKEGIRLKDKQFFRTAALHTMTARGKEQMLDLGIRNIVDLRSTYEVNESPDPFTKGGDIHYYHFPMLDNMQSKLPSETFDAFTSMDQLYYIMLEEHKKEFREVLNTMADDQQGTIFHCAVGKDRTGLTSMFLLSAADVSDDMIIEDYALSKPLEGIVQRGNNKVPSYVMEAPPLVMKNTLGWLSEHYGGPLSYLKEIGVTPDEIKAIRYKFGVL